MKLGVDVTEVVLSNAGPTGEFRIRNSAKAFKILSDGLYSNKIKAIVRELSCNALDSHVGAGKKDVPFEVHLPTMFEPWFSVRDFGLGLSADQVENIYTTYFESTKTDSNDYIGALGLGSKSPFSYTDNFTVTATQGGRQAIFSAFINDAGVPSVAKMSDVLSDEPNGVEVKFGVTDKYAYQSFRNEATEVFKWFPSKPNVIGDSNYRHAEIRFRSKDLVPSVSELEGGYGECYALMGNICYPLNNMPEPEKHLGKLVNLLSCGLLLKFEIGELDFAASREQLSYVPLTINSIKKKLELLNDSLADVLAVKADAIKSEWERAVYLTTQTRSKLFSQAVPAYAKKRNFALFDETNYGNYVFKLKSDDLKKKGLEVTGFTADRGTCFVIQKNKEWDRTGKTQVQHEMMQLTVSPNAVVVLNDLKIGCNARSRHHFGQLTKTNRNTHPVFCFSSDKADPVERQAVYDALIKELHNPPTIIKASELSKKEPTPRDPLSNVGIAVMAKKSSRSGYREEGYTWAPTSETLDDKKKYYYCALSGFESYRPETGNSFRKIHGEKFSMTEIRFLMKSSGLPEFENFNIHGVRKSRIEELKGRKNWIWVEDKISEIIKTVNTKTVVDMVSATILDDYNSRVYINGTVAKLLDADSEYKKFMSKYGTAGKTTGDISALVTLCSLYGNIVEVEKVKKQIRDDKVALNNKYPLLKYFYRTGVTETEALEYIKLIDKQEKN